MLSHAAPSRMQDMGENRDDEVFETAQVCAAPSTERMVPVT